jgi:hypothetical protein
MLGDEREKNTIMGLAGESMKARSSMNIYGCDGQRHSDGCLLQGGIISILATMSLLKKPFGQLPVCTDDHKKV